MTFVQKSEICRHLKKIRKLSKLGVWVPHVLREKNKKDCISIVLTLLSSQRNYPFLNNIITDDEISVFYDTVQCKRQRIGQDVFPQTIPKVELHGRKVMMCVWGDHCGIIPFETVNYRHSMWTCSFNCCNVCMKV